MQTTTHTRIYLETLKYLRRIHAETGEKMLDILNRLLIQEWNRIKTDGEKQDDKRNLYNN